jgi:RNA polymerase sigma-70 factor (sigma-E family)
MMAVMELDRGGALALVHREHYRSLVRLAALLGDRSMAEEVVQDAFVRVYGAGDRVRDPLAYLRRAVVNGARSTLRRKQVRERAPLAIARDVPPPDDRTDVINALRALPARQRECLVLRYYADLSEREIADALGVSPGSVKTHTHRGLAALEKSLEGNR